MRAPGRQSLAAWASRRSLDGFGGGTRSNVSRKGPYESGRSAIAVRNEQECGVSPVEGSQPRIDVVILTWNDGPLLSRALTSVFACEDVRLNVIVVDNASSPPADVEDHPSVSLIRNNANRGVAPARNQGAKLGSAPLVCFLDSDAVLHPESLARLSNAVLSQGRVALAAPVFVGQAPGASGGRAPTLRRKLARMAGLSDRYEEADRAPGATTWDVDFAIGACQLVRRAAFEEVGGLDESYFYGPEDVDFCLRLREAGWRIVQVADAPVEHPPRRRNRRLLTVRGIRHAWAVCRHLWRHRNFEQRVERESSRPVA